MSRSSHGARGTKSETMNDAPEARCLRRPSPTALRLLRRRRLAHTRAVKRVLPARFAARFLSFALRARFARGVPVLTLDSGDTRGAPPACGAHAPAHGAYGLDESLLFATP